jgi:hypothetical protein
MRHDLALQVGDRTSRVAGNRNVKLLSVMLHPQSAMTSGGDAAEPPPESHSLNELRVGLREG